MSGERRPRPDDQVRKALALAHAEGQPFEEAWVLATHGQVCDSYTSARGRRTVGAQTTFEQAPGLRPSTGKPRCAGCRFVSGAGDGMARCTLYSIEIYPGVLWPHRTHDRHEWQHGLFGDPTWEDDDRALAIGWIRAPYGTARADRLAAALEEVISEVVADRPDIGTMPEWQAAYEGRSSAYSTLHAMLVSHGQPLPEVYAPTADGRTMAA
jgi:hypothetical protein